MKLKALKITALVIVSLMAFVLLLGIGYAVYVMCQYSRIEDNLLIETESNTNEIVLLDGEYDMATYNVGYGAYDHDYSFVMDSGRLKDEYGGKKTGGVKGKAVSRDNVLKNMNGSIDALREENFGSKLDFVMFQEIDTKASRSYEVNQYEMAKDVLGGEYGMGSMFSVNFHTAYLLYPIHDPHGVNVSGIATFSKYKIDSNIRKSYPVSNGFDKYFDLDRCFVISRLKVDNGKELVLINNHMSAYDKGGTIRAKQLKLLNDALAVEREKGNYVIVGGDFNHDVANSKNTFESWSVVPDESNNGWLYQLFDGKNVQNGDNPSYSDIAEGYSFATTIYGKDGSTLVPTCRCADIPYERDDNGIVKNYQAVLDGYIVSDNIEVVKVENIDTDFLYSDHNPVHLRFKLK